MSFEISIKHTFKPSNQLHTLCFWEFKLCTTIFFNWKALATPNLIKPKTLHSTLHSGISRRNRNIFQTKSKVRIKDDPWRNLVRIIQYYYISWRIIHRIFVQKWKWYARLQRRLYQSFDFQIFGNKEHFQDLQIIVTIQNICLYNREFFERSV